MYMNCDKKIHAIIYISTQYTSIEYSKYCTIGINIISTCITHPYLMYTSVLRCIPLILLHITQIQTNSQQLFLSKKPPNVQSILCIAKWAPGVGEQLQLKLIMVTFNLIFGYACLILQNMQLQNVKKILISQLPH